MQNKYWNNGKWNSSVSNPNLLDNWDFRNPVNTQVKSSYLSTNYSYTIDRWCSANCDVTLTSNGLNIKGLTTDNWSNKFYQLSSVRCSDKIVTISFTVNGVIYSSTGIPNTNVVKQFDNGIYISMGVDAGGLTYLQLSIPYNTTMLVSSTKLELGSVSTLINDSISNFQQQTMICQSLSDDGQTYTRGFGSNKNILHNWDFGKPINQRNWSSSTSSTGYTIDRWNYNSSGTSTTTFSLDTANKCIKLTNSVADTGLSYINQEIEYPSNYSGKVVTFSFEYTASGNNHIEVWSSNGNVSALVPVSGGKNIYSLTWTVPNGLTDSNQLRVVFIHYVGDIGTLNIYRVKLELGSVSTLSNDPPADYGEQLALCQRYFVTLNPNASTYINIADGFGYSTSAARIMIQLPTQMRIRPSIWMSDNSKVTTLQLYSTESVYSSITAMDVNAYSDGLRYVEIFCYATVLVNQNYILRTTSDAVIVGFSAEL